MIEEVNTKIVIITYCPGGTVGFVCSWFSVGAFLSPPPTIVSFLLLRTLAQQVFHNAQYRKLRTSIGNFLLNTEKQLDNSSKIKLEDLNTNKNAAFKQAA